LEEYTCVEVNHHKKIANVINEYQKKGWYLHTYACAGVGFGTIHYLHFEREAASS